MADRTIVVLGGGTGGLVAARRLRRSLDAADRVVLVDRSPTYRFAPSFLWVMSGARRAEQISTDRRRLRRRGIEVHEAEVHGIDTTNHKISTSEAELTFDRLVVALGVELAPDVLPGFADAAHNVYTLDGAAAAGAALGRFDGKGACFVELGDGRAAFAGGDFYAADGPSIRLRRPGRHWHLAKVAFEQYWMRRWA